MGAGTFTFSTGNDPAQTITTTASTTLSDLAQQINTVNKDVAASIVSTDGTTYKLVLRSLSSGQANTINVGGTLTGLQASDFSLVQAGKDAKLTIGSGAGALTVTRPSNTITDLAPGLTVNLLTTTSDPVTVTAGKSADGVVKTLQALVSDFNNVVNTTKDLGKIDPADSTKNGILAGDASLLSVSSRLSGLIGQAVSGLNGPLSYINGAGLSIQRDGTLALDETKLRASLASDWSGRHPAVLPQRHAERQPGAVRERDERHGRRLVRRADHPGRDGGDGHRGRLRGAGRRHAAHDPLVGQVRRRHRRRRGRPSTRPSPPSTTPSTPRASRRCGPATRPGP